MPTIGVNTAQSFIVVLFLLNDSVCFGQEVVNKMTNPSICQPNALARTASKNHPDNASVWQVDWAAAGSRPSAPIYDYRESSEIVSALVAGDKPYGTDRGYIAQWETTEGDWRSIRGQAVLKDNGGDCDGNASGTHHASWDWTAKCNIKTGITPARLTQKQCVVNAKIGSVNVPNAVIGEVDSGHGAWRFPIWVGQSSDHMIGRYEGTIDGNKESSSFDGTQFPISSWMSLNANNRRNRALDICNGIHKQGLFLSRSRGQWIRDAMSNATSQANTDGVDSDKTNIESASGSGVVHNDGSFMGKCVITSTRDTRDYQCDR